LESPDLIAQTTMARVGHELAIGATTPWDSVPTE
jgi:hypothetical protein